MENNELTTYEPDEQYMVAFSGFEDEPQKNMNAKLVAHAKKMSLIRHERPDTRIPYKVGIYIRFFNQTSHDDEMYLQLTKKNYCDTIDLCPKWQLVDFYIDEGNRPPKIESSKELCRLIDDCLDGKVDLIITQKVSNMSTDTNEITILSSLLANQEHPIGIYFISEDIFTLASYFVKDYKAHSLLPEPDWRRPEDEARGKLNG